MTTNEINCYEKHLWLTAYNMVLDDNDFNLNTATGFADTVIEAYRRFKEIKKSSEEFVKDVKIPRDMQREAIPYHPLKEKKS